MSKGIIEIVYLGVVDEGYESPHRVTGEGFESPKTVQIPGKTHSKFPRTTGGPSPSGLGGSCSLRGVPLEQET